ncbi:hypothetical protein [Zavarzinia aquatilis]|uniref:Uncharacterized protein n=1 Tax=Zavarzinia aquatilis TaxID=2211142 RepID=A0A317ED66_9PROT|nr:hypothetical protein [Zavarzinia aquatilis]PWR24977.1 hypothetical protein DKG74_04200 [Zavarzinia aquatilis]
MADPVQTPATPPAPGAGATLLAGQPPATPSATPPAGATPATPPAGTTPATPWYSETHKDLVALKKWSGPDDVLHSYASLEALVGADKIAIPKPTDEPAAWDAVWNRLGRPVTPADYKLPVPEGDNGEFAATMAPILHKAGLTQGQANTLATAWNEMQAAQARAADEARKTQGLKEVADLQKEWGAHYDTNVELGSRAFRLFASDQDAELIHKVETALGAGGLIKMFNRIGAAMGVGTLEGGAPQPGGFGGGAAAAKAEIETLKGDKAFMDAYLFGTGPAHKEAVAKMETLQKLAAGGA